MYAGRLMYSGGLNEMRITFSECETREGKMTEPRLDEEFFERVQTKNLDLTTSLHPLNYLADVVHDLRAVHQIQHNHLVFLPTLILEK